MFAVPVPNLPDEQELIPTGNLTESRTDEQVTQQFITIFAEGG
ncbi:MAG TPA: hypothetical protein VE641_14850 [Chthoniobacterales bacterium]|nr:hypothetical protein [Chthoniobacterales bacterium]